MDELNVKKEFETSRDVCRLCLAVKIRTLVITNTILQDAYERITNVRLNTIPEPQYVCYICYARLKQCYRLIQQAISTEKLLKEAVVNGIEISELAKSQLWKLSTASLVSVNLNPSDVLDIKEIGYVKEEIKCEEDINITGQELEDLEAEESEVDTKNNIYVSDSEDDLPLQKISSKGNKGTKLDKENEKQISKTIGKLEAKELLLDEKEQMAELLERSKSLNYLNSPYKCDLCYKGFRDPTAFTKHKDKHESKSGRLECNICHLRYGSKQALNSHTVAAHSRRFACTTCSHVSLTKNQAVVHEKWHNGHRYPCKLCDKHFIKPTSYMSHMRKVHANFSEHVCHKCGESFAGRHGLLMHLSKTHKHDRKAPDIEPDPTSESYCEECRIQFLTTDAYKLHLLSSQKHKHTVWKENGSKCKICNALVSGFDRDRHERMHARELKPKVAESVDATPPTVHIPCGQCSKSFTSRSRLHMHVKRMHLGQRYNRNVVCEVCGKYCTSNATLRYHQRAHTGERPYPCDKCTSRFSSREHWRVHQRVHSGERPYSCAVCGHSFSQKPALNRHYIVHTGAKPYECHLCNKTFTQSASMKKHIQRVHLKQPANRKKSDDSTEKTS